jgi:hypothetical protein
MTQEYRMSLPWAVQPYRTRSGHTCSTDMRCVELRRFAARASGLAIGLAPAVRPAGSVEAPGSTARRRRVPRSGMRSTVEAGGADPDNARRSGRWL